MSRIWQVQRGSRVENLTEAKLRGALREGHLSGVELARPTGEEWAPLWSYDLYREEVATTAEDAGGTAAWRILRWAAWHSAALLIAGVFLEWPEWTTKWSAMVALHWAWASWRTWPALRGRRRMSAQPGAQVAALDPQQLLTGPRQDEATTQLDETLNGLRSAAPEVAALPDVAALRRGVAGLHSQRVQLEALATAQHVDALRTEEEDLRKRLAQAAGVLKDELTVQLAAVMERRRGVETARSLAERLRVREETVMHQLGALRLAVIQAAAASESLPDLATRIRELREQTRAEEEVAAAMAQARATLNVVENDEEPGPAPVEVAAHLAAVKKTLG